MKRLFLKVLVFFIALQFTIFTSAEETPEPQYFDPMLTVSAELEYNYQTFRSSAETLKDKNAYFKALKEHHKELMAIEKRAYNIQQVMTVLIFFVVTALVLGGLWLSYMQFKLDITASSDQEKQKASFKIGKSGIEFSSSVIGLIVLFMSFFFFHMYIQDVYTIKLDKVEMLQFTTDAPTGEESNSG